MSEDPENGVETFSPLKHKKDFVLFLESDPPVRVREQVPIKLKKQNECLS